MSKPEHANEGFVLAPKGSVLGSQCWPKDSVIVSS